MIAGLAVDDAETHSTETYCGLCRNKPGITPKYVFFFFFQTFERKTHFGVNTDLSLVSRRISQTPP